MSCPSRYQENLISPKQETFSLVQNTNFLWFCNGKLSILKYKIFLVIGLWVIKTLFSGRFLPPPPRSVTQFSSAKTQHLGERLWQVTPLCPDSQWPYPAPHVPQTPFKSELELAGSTCQLWSEGSKKHWVMGKSGLNFQTCTFTWDLVSFGSDVPLSLDY